MQYDICAKAWRVYVQYAARTTQLNALRRWRWYAHKQGVQMLLVWLLTLTIWCPRIIGRTGPREWSAYRLEFPCEPRCSVQDITFDSNSEHIT